MALINCSDCGHQVSSNAESCPKCGNPIASAINYRSTGDQIKTVQETSKRFKLQAILSVLTIMFGGTWLWIVLRAPGAGSVEMPLLATIFGIIWYCFNRFRIWWHHK